MIQSGISISDDNVTTAELHRNAKAKLFTMYFVEVIKIFHI